MEIVYTNIYKIDLHKGALFHPFSGAHVNNSLLLELNNKNIDLPKIRGRS